MNLSTLDEDIRMVRKHIAALDADVRNAFDRILADYGNTELHVARLEDDLQTEADNAKEWAAQAQSLAEHRDNLMSRIAELEHETERKQFQLDGAEALLKEADGTPR